MASYSETKLVPPTGMQIPAPHSDTDYSNDPEVPRSPCQLYEDKDCVIDFSHASCLHERKCVVVLAMSAGRRQKMSNMPYCLTFRVDETT